MRKKQGLFEDYYSWNITSKMLSDAYGQMMSDQAQPLQVGFYLKYSLKQLKGLNVESGISYLLLFLLYSFPLFCCCSVAKSCLTLCDLMGYSPPDSSVLQDLLEFAQIHVHLEKEMATHSSILAWRIPRMGTWQAAVYGVTQSRTRLTQLSSLSACPSSW